MTAAPTRMPPPPPRNGAPAVAAPSIKPRLGKPAADTMGSAVVLNGSEGVGKTSAACHAPAPLILMARGETGYVTLRNAGRVPDIDTLTDEAGKPKTIDSWAELLAVLDSDLSAYKTIILDAMGGFERLAHELVCTRDYRGDWSEKGFANFQKGFEVAVSDWVGMLAKLDRLRHQGMNVILLSHAKIGGVKNPDGSDYTQFTADCRKETWSVTARWADAVLFYRFVTVVDAVKQGKGKGIGGADREVRTEGRDAFVAKNRYGMPPVIEVPADPAAAYQAIFGLINKPG